VQVQVGAGAPRGCGRVEEGHHHRVAERAGRGVEGEGRQRQIELADHVQRASRGVEGQVAGPGARPHGRRADRGERAGAGVERVDGHAIGAEIGGHRPAVARVGEDAVRVRSLLPVGARPAPGVLVEEGTRAGAAVGAQWKGGDAAAHVVGDHEQPPGRIGGDVARRAAAGGDGLAQRREVAGGAVDGEGAHGARRGAGEAVDLVHDVQHAAVGVDGEERRVGADVGGAERGPGAGAWVGAEAVDAAAGRLLGVGADEDERARAGGGRGRVGGRRGAGGAATGARRAAGEPGRGARGGGGEEGAAAHAVRGWGRGGAGAAGAGGPARGTWRAVPA
jgi:hypothetical protein